MRFRLLLLLVVLLFGLTSVLAQDKNEKVKSTKTITGKFVGFESGDYLHAIIKDSKGEEVTFFIGGVGLDFFLATHANKSGSFTYQNVEVYMEEAGGRVTIERLTKAKVGKETSTSWWAALRKKMSLDAINKKYQPAVEKLTRNPG